MRKYEKLAIKKTLIKKQRKRVVVRRIFVKLLKKLILLPRLIKTDPGITKKSKKQP